jgi:hypothetical protein
MIVWVCLRVPAGAAWSGASDGRCPIELDATFAADHREEKQAEELKITW